MNGDAQQYRYVYKSETGSDKIISLVLYDPDRGELHRFGGPGQPAVQVGAEILSLADVIISHSMYHFKAITRFCGVSLARPCWLDTAVLAKAAWGHQNNGMDAWASRLGYQRKAFRGADHWSPEAEQRCERDVIMIADLFDRIQAEVPV